MKISIVCNGKTYTPRTAKKEFTCSECKLPIIPGEDYWSITLNGAGVGSLKYPDRIHIACAPGSILRNKKEAGDNNG